MKAWNIWKSSPFWVAQRHSPPHPVPWRNTVWGQELTPHLWIETIFPFQHMALSHSVSKWNGVKETFGKENKNYSFFPFFGFHFLVQLFLGFFFPVHHFLRPQVPGHPVWHNPDLAPSGSKESHSFGASRQKVHWKGHRRGFVLPKEDEKLQEKPGCWLQRN